MLLMEQKQRVAINKRPKIAIGDNEANNKINGTYFETNYHEILGKVAANNTVLKTVNIMKIKKESVKSTSKN
jgi:hypothetical protein